MVGKLFNKQKTTYSDKEYQKHRFKGCCMWSFPVISIRSSLILLYVNNLQYGQNLLDPIMFADDTNLFYADGKIKNLFDTVNIES